MMCECVFERGRWNGAGNTEVIQTSVWTPSEGVRFFDLILNVVFHIIYLHFGGFDTQIVALVGIAVGQQFFALAGK